MRKSKLIRVSPKIEKEDPPAEKDEQPPENPPRLDDFIRAKVRASVAALGNLKDFIVTSHRERIAKWQAWDRGIGECVERIRGAKRRCQRTLDEELADPEFEAKKARIIEIALERHRRTDEIIYQESK